MDDFLSESMKRERVIAISYNQIRLDEAIYLLKNHDDGGHFDADKEALVLVE